MTKIIAFSGRKQSGKSTSGEYIIDYIKRNDIPITYKLYSFADPLKQDICINLLGLTYEQCYGTDEEKNSLTSLKWEDMPGYSLTWNVSGPMTARQVMEFVGTGIFRKMYNNIWVDATMLKIQKENFDLAILLDNRFPNEVDSVLKNNGYIIRLTRDPYHSDAEPEVALDPTNYNWTNFSLIINNENMSNDEKNKEVLNFLADKGILPL
jgi:hypothetical protein